MAGGSSYRALEKKVATLEAKLAGLEGSLVAITQASGFVLGVLATRPDAGNVINALADHHAREHDRLKASGKFTETFLSDYIFVIETVTGTARCLATAMKNRSKAGASDGC